MPPRVANALFLARKTQDRVNALIPFLSSHVLHYVNMPKRHGGVLSSVD